MNFQEPLTIDSINSYSAMPIRRVERETMDQYINLTAQYFSSICTGKDFTMLNLCMSELINNVYDHSHSTIGAYVFCQFYPNKNEIIFCVGDLGLGIPESVNTYLANKGLDVISKIDCVKWAVREKNTTQSLPYNAGRGLDTVSSFVKSNKSTWKLFTTDVQMIGNYYAGRRFSENSIHNFIGTIAEVKIKVNNLDELIDLEELDF